MKASAYKYLPRDDRKRTYLIRGVAARFAKTARVARRYVDDAAEYADRALDAPEADGVRDTISWALAACDDIIKAAWILEEAACDLKQEVER